MRELAIANQSAEDFLCINQPDSPNIHPPTANTKSVFSRTKKFPPEAIQCSSESIMIGISSAIFFNPKKRPAPKPKISNERTNGYLDLGFTHKQYSDNGAVYETKWVKFDGKSYNLKKN